MDTFSFKKLLQTLPRGEPLGSTFLKSHGLSPAHASHLARDGWLVHLARGVYMLPGDNLTRDGCLAFLTERMPGLHVAGRTALAWRGSRYAISFRERLVLWSDRQARLPPWFTSRFECSYQSTALFKPSLPPAFGLQPLPGGDPRVMVSVPERAILELLSDVGKTASVEDARALLDGLHSLRKSVLETLLEHTTRIKVIRLARQLAEELDLPWAEVARLRSEKAGGKRWVSRTRTGERLDLKQ